MVREKNGNDWVIRGIKLKAIELRVLDRITTLALIFFPTQTLAVVRENPVQLEIVRLSRAR